MNKPVASLLLTALTLPAVCACALDQTAADVQPAGQTDQAPVQQVPAATQAAAETTEAAEDIVLAAEPDLEADGFVSLFNGRNLEGWQVANGTSQYIVYDDSILGVCVRGSPNTFLRTTRDDYANFVFTCEFMLVHAANGGIQFRSHQREAGDGAHDGRVWGYQSEIDPRTDRAWTAGIFAEAWRGWLAPVDREDQADARDALNMDGWNRVTIRAVGNHIETWLNGVPVTNFVDDHEEAQSSGFFALQVHGGRHGLFRWRQINIQELDEAGQPLSQEAEAEAEG